MLNIFDNLLKNIEDEVVVVSAWAYLYKSERSRLDEHRDKCDKVVSLKVILI